MQLDKKEIQILNNGKYLRFRMLRWLAGPHRHVLSREILSHRDKVAELPDLASIIVELFPEDMPCRLVASTQQGVLVVRIAFGTRPACEHKGDLVDEVRNVVGHVEVDFVHCSEQVTE